MYTRVAETRTTSDARRIAPPAAPDLGARSNAELDDKTSAPRVTGVLGRLLARGFVRAPQLEAQRAFNADQVRLDNALLRYVEERLAATHRHYDRILGRTGQRHDEVDARHRLLERELVQHVHDLARRIDLVLARPTAAGRRLEHALADLRARLARIEEALQPEPA